ncbi:MAG: DNA topoisomerase IV subunit A [Deltaproteobacteria bacterium]|nr:MAG: DNA topoisomerase IV subunit A [Deltaproteobacteria bacterium]
MLAVEPVPLHIAARERYLSYALSVITSRALPDVRDGLKPVQRRILYTMFNELRLHPGGRYRKCAAVVGEVMGKFHPHGDASIYDALVRMAQPFSLLAPLVDGQGNFGSLDGDRAAAMRYTECKLRPLAEELISEIKKSTVDFRPNYDGQRFEPIVLPAQFPQLLVNGSEGIAVGMATRIPPHNLREVINAAVALIDDPECTTRDLCAYVLGPDFPTGGKILNDSEELVEIYEEGGGKVRLRANYEVEKDGRRKLIVIDSVPYGSNKASILEKIGAEVQAKKLPQVLDVRDESTEDIRIVIEVKMSGSVEAVMAYLYKHTPLEGSFPVNMTALVPVEGTDVAQPRKLALADALRHWLDFRFDTVRRRFEHDLAKLRERIHILEGFAAIFLDLDRAIKLIRESEGKRDAAERLMDAFDLSEVQTDAILELKLYRLAKLEIQLINEELEEKREEAESIEDILASSVKLWGVVRRELLEIRDLYGEDRRTIVGEPVKDLTYNEDAYIVKEDAYVVVTRDGWIKRQSSFSELDKIRIRDEDEIGWLIKAHTRSTITFFGSHGAAYVMRVDDVPATTGYGEPLQRHFNFSDGEKVVGVISHDARHRILVQETLPLEDGTPPPPYAVAVTLMGKVVRFPIATHEDTSTKAGRLYCRVDPKKGDAVLAVLPTEGGEHACVASRLGRAMLFPVDDIPPRKGVSKGVIGLKLRDDDEIMAFGLAKNSIQGPTVITAKGREINVSERKFGISSRGGRGNVVLQRGSIETWVRQPTLQLGKTDDPPADADEEVEA